MNGLVMIEVSETTYVKNEEKTIGVIKAKRKYTSDSQMIEIHLSPVNDDQLSQHLYFSSAEYGSDYQEYAESFIRALQRIINEPREFPNE